MSIKVLEPSREDSNSCQPTHIAFTDESQYNVGQFGSVGMVSLRYSDFKSVSADVSKIIQRLGMTEFKWTRLSGVRERSTAIELLEYVVDKAATGVLRLDILTWDKEDSRHTIKKRDDIANLHRMYHHILKNVLRERWHNDSLWLLCPDEHLSMKWNSVDHFLDNSSYKVNLTPSLFKVNRFFDLEQAFSIHDIRPCKSHEEPLIQLVDLFTGMATYSRGEYEKYVEWQANNTDSQIELFSSGRVTPTQLSKADKERCSVLHQFSSRSKSKKLGVSLQTHRGLRTLDPKQPVNFWWYMPQHDSDKAPTKQKKHW